MHYVIRLGDGRFYGDTEHTRDITKAARFYSRADALQIIGIRGDRTARVVTVSSKSWPRFKNVYCSQCGRDFGPGDEGYSMCKDHQAEDAPDEDTLTKARGER